MADHHLHETARFGARAMTAKLWMIVSHFFAAIRQGAMTAKLWMIVSRFFAAIRQGGISAKF